MVNSFHYSEHVFFYVEIKWDFVEIDGCDFERRSIFGRKYKKELSRENFEVLWGFFLTRIVVYSSGLRTFRE